MKTIVSYASTSSMDIPKHRKSLIIKSSSQTHRTDIRTWSCTSNMDSDMGCMFSCSRVDNSLMNIIIRIYSTALSTRISMWYSIFNYNTINKAFGILNTSFNSVKGSIMMSMLRGILLKAKKDNNCLYMRCSSMLGLCTICMFKNILNMFSE